MQPRGCNCVFLQEQIVFHHLGFPQTPTLLFLDIDAMLPTASTCTLVLHLPIRYTSYEAFKNAMIEALVSNGGLDGGP